MAERDEGLMRWVRERTGGRDFSSSTRSQPRTPQGAALVDQYAQRFSQSKTPSVAATKLTSLTDFFAPGETKPAVVQQAEEETRTEGKLRALRGGVGLPTYASPKAPLRSGLPESAEPWAASPTTPGTAQVLDVPVRQDDETDEFVKEEAILPRSPIPEEALTRFVSPSAKVGWTADPEERRAISLTSTSPVAAQREWLRESFAKPNPQGTLSEPTFGEQLAGAIPGVAIGLGEQALESVGLNDPEPWIPRAGGAWGYETGRALPRVVAEAPKAVAGHIGKRLQRAWEAVEQYDPGQAPGGFLDEVAAIAPAIFKGIEAATGIPADFWEKAENREVEEAAKARAAGLISDAEFMDVLESNTGLTSYLPSPSTVGGNALDVVAGLLTLVKEAVTAPGDPALSVDERIDKLGALGADFALGAGGSAIKSAARPFKMLEEAPIEHYFNVRMGAEPFRRQAAPLTPVDPALRDTALDLTRERNAAQGEAKVAAEAVTDLSMRAEDLALQGFPEQPAVQRVISAKQRRIEAERRVKAAEEAVAGERAVRPAMREGLDVGLDATTAEVGSSRVATKGERARLSDAVRVQSEAVAKAENRVQAVRRALEEHGQSRPSADWREVSKEYWRAKRSKSASAARRSTKNRAKGEATVAAQERLIAATKARDALKPWFEQDRALRGELKRAAKELIDAKGALNRARADDGLVAKLTQAEQVALLRRKAVEASAEAAKGTRPSVGELQELAAQARKEARDLKAEEAAAGREVVYPSQRSAKLAKTLMEREARAADVRRLRDEYRVAQEARLKHEAASEARLRTLNEDVRRATETAKHYDPVPRTPEERALTSEVRRLESEVPALRREAKAAAAALEAAEMQARQKGAADTSYFFGDEAAASDAAVALTKARERAAAATSALGDMESQLATARESLTSVRYSGLTPEHRAVAQAAERKVAQLEAATRQAREHAQATGDTAAMELSRYLTRDLQAAKADLAKIRAVGGMNVARGDARGSKLRTDAEALRARMVAQRRQSERVGRRLAAQEALAKKALADSERVLSKIDDPIRRIVERNAKASEAAREWATTREPEWKAAVEALNKAEDAFTKSESRQWWTEQIVKQAPVHFLMGGTTLVWEAAKRLVNRQLDKSGRQWLSSALRSKDGRIQAALRDEMDRAAGRSQAIKLEIEEALAQVPEVHRPTVAKWMWMEHDLAEGGWWRQGNFNFARNAEPAGHWSTWDKAANRWKVTEYGKRRLAELESEAAKHPAGSPEWKAVTDEAVRFKTELDVANKFGTRLVVATKALEQRAMDAGLPGMAESLRPIYLPQMLTAEAQAAKRAQTIGERGGAQLTAKTIRERIKEFTDTKTPGPKAKGEIGAPVQTPDLSEYRTSMLRETGVPMSERIMRYDVDPSLANQIAALDRLMYDTQLREVFNYIGTKQALTPEEFQARRALDVAQREVRGTGDMRKSDLDADWVRMAEDPKYGEMAGKYIPAEDYFELANMQNIATEAQSLVHRLNQKVKGFKTVHNPTTANRNWFTSMFVFAPAAKVSVWNKRNIPYYADVVSDLMKPYSKRSPLHREMVESGHLDGSLMSVELGGEVGNQWMSALQRGGTEPALQVIRAMYEVPKTTWKRVAESGEIKAERAARDAWMKRYDNPKLTRAQRLELLKEKPATPRLDALERSNDVIARGLKAPVQGAWSLAQDYYRFADQLPKEVFYRKARESGMTPAQAGRAMRERFPAYGDIPYAAHVVRAPHSLIGPRGEPIKALQGLWWLSSVPFVAYSATAIPIFMKWAKENPAQGAALLAFHDALTAQNLRDAGMDEQEAAAREKAQPSYLRPNQRLMARFSPRLAKDAEGDDRFLGTQWLNPVSDVNLPWDDSKSTAENLIAATKALMGVGENWLVNPVIGAATGYDVGSPTGYRVWSADDANVGERVVSHLVRAWLPPWFPSVTDIQAGEMGAQYGEGSRIGGGSLWESYAGAASGRPSRQGRYTTDDELAAALAGFKVRTSSVDDALASLNKTLTDRLASARLDAERSATRTGARLTELAEYNEEAYNKATTGLMKRMIHDVLRSYQALAGLEDPRQERVQEYKAGLKDVLDRYSDGETVYRDLLAQGASEAEAQSSRQYEISQAYELLRDLTGGAIQAAGEAYRDVRLEGLGVSP